MAQASLRSQDQPAGAVTLVAAGRLAQEVAAVLAQRGLITNAIVDDAAIGRERLEAAGLVAWAPRDLAAPAYLARVCAAAASRGAPPLVLLPAQAADTANDEDAIDARAVAIAHMRAAGAALLTDVDAWIEAIVLCARMTVPRGPKVAVIAAPGGVIATAAELLAQEATLPRTVMLNAPDGPSDAVLYEVGLVPMPGLPCALPLVARAEMRGDGDALVGLRAAISAVDAVGRAMERARQAAAHNDLRDQLQVDWDRAERQLAKAGPFARRIGDHETKVLLAAFGVSVIRQAVATTPSAAIRLAKKVGFPVEMKAWGPEAKTEAEGAQVETGLLSASDVRRAMMAVGGAGVAMGAGLEEVEDGPAVIVREIPPPGRELTIRFEDVAGLGWTCRVWARGARAPAAAPVPLLPSDARLLATHAMASRAGETSPDLEALADCLLRASHLAEWLRTRSLRLELGRVLAGARVVVVDAAIDLRP